MIPDIPAVLLSLSVRTDRAAAATTDAIKVTKNMHNSL